MAKYKVEVDDELIDYFKNNVDNSESTEIMLAKLLKLLREIFNIANKNK